MLLRESGKKEAVTYNLQGVFGLEEVGLANEAEILALTDAICRGEHASIEEHRCAAIQVIGPQMTADVIMVAAGFNGITKIANGTGLHLDPDTEDRTSEMRVSTGIDSYSESAKSKRFDL